MELLYKALLMAKKDLMIESRRSYELFSILLFAATSIIVASITWGAPAVIGAEAGSVTFWIILFFANILTLTTTFAREIDKGTIGGLRTLPCSPLAVLLGKVIYSVTLLTLVLLTMLPLAVAFLNLQASKLFLELLPIFFLGILDLSFAGAFVAGLVMYSEGKTLLLAFLLFPISFPILVSSLIATQRLLLGATFLEASNEIKLLLAFLLILLLISIFTFEEVLEE
jgi:heme exporter protein CcmB